MPSDSSIAVILAAGQSRRFGEQDKRLHKLPNGQTMLLAVYQQACLVFDLVVVVIRPADRLEWLGLPIETRSIVTENSEKGMGHSLSDAFIELCDQVEYEGFSTAAVLLADMPFIQTSTLKTLEQQASRDKIIRSIYQHKDGKKTKGHPVFFGRDFWPNLKELKGDQGAKKYLSLYENQVSYVTVQDLGVVYDVDEPESSMSFKLST